MTSLLKTLLQLSWRWPRLVLMVAFGLMLELTFLSGLPYSFRFIVDQGILARQYDWLVQIFALLLLGAVLFAVVGYQRDRALAGLIANMLDNLRTAMVQRCHNAPMSWLAGQRRSELVTRFSGDLGAVEQALQAAAPWAVLPGLEVVANTLLLFTLDWRLAALSLLVFPAAMIGPRFLVPRASAAAIARRQHEGAALASVDEQLAAQTSARAFGLQLSQIARYRSESRDVRLQTFGQGLLSALVERSATSAIMLLNVLVLGFGCWLVVEGSLSVGELAAFQSLFLSLSWALSYLAQFVPIWIAAEGAYVRLADILHAPQLHAASKQAQKAVTNIAHGVRFSKVSFNYGARVALDQLDLELARGRSVALVGGSGSGKSTVISLLLGFEQPSAGDILLDGAPLSDHDLASWRQQLGVVFQETFIFSASVADNLRVGKLNATQAELEAAARQAGIHDVIVSLPKGYLSLLGEGKIGLSGGQRQRIGIARALLRKPAILVLDEPTSALDVATEQQVQETLEHVAKHRTMLLVTHRLQQASRCEHIVVLENGRAVEAGAHTQLLARGGRYASMWRKQHGFSFDGAAAKVSVARLSEIALFNGLPAEFLAQVSSMFASENVHVGAMLVQQGDIGNRFYLLARGMVEVFRVDADSREQSLAILTDGDSFGEIALLAERPRTASVRAMLESTVLTLTKAQLDVLLAQHPELGTRMRAVAIERLKGQR
jgi:ATP-binding cassette, subfamily B, bacterial